MTKQRGQAMVEMLVVSISILMLLWGLLWLQRWQQIKLQTQHYAALQAFRFSQSYELEQKAVIASKPNYLSGLFSSIAHQENTQKQLLGFMPLSDQLLTHAREEGLFGQTQRWRFTSTAKAEDWFNSAWAQSIFDFMPDMTLQSQTSIWVGAGHAHHDQDAIKRIEGSLTLWGKAQKNSALAIHSLTPLFMPVDMGWNRAQPTIKWLQPWQESIPAHHLGAEEKK